MRWQSARRFLLLASSAAAGLTARVKCDRTPTGYSLDCYCVLKVVGAAQTRQNAAVVYFIRSTSKNSRPAYIFHPTPTHKHPEERGVRMSPTDIRHRFSGATRIANGRRHAPTPEEAYLTGLVTVMKLSCAAPYRQPAFERQHERAIRSVPDSVVFGLGSLILLPKQHLKTKIATESGLSPITSHTASGQSGPRDSNVQLKTKTTTAYSLSKGGLIFRSKAVGAYLDSPPRPPAEDRGAT